MRTLAMAGVLGAVGLVVAARIDGQDAVVETLLRLKVAAAVIDAEAPQGSGFPPPHGTFVTLASLRQVLAPAHRARIADTGDLWGRPLLYWSNGTHYMLASWGADGEPDFPYTGEVPWSEIAQGTTGGVNADLLIVDGEVWRGPTSDKFKIRRAMADMRSIGTAIESYTVDYSHYLESGGYQDMAVLEPELEPLYIRNLPEMDPWQLPFHVWSRPTVGYALVSYGSDLQPEFPYETWGASEWSALDPISTNEPGRDLIFVNGQFVRWPATAPR
ncbi:MAG TPA: hypothetical protein VFV75_11985 [Candidatus Polarisedimenticolaceae bacterium]|nr:hypothetical protein [Candidatus Polarisedimenticolaceae bacterium]